MVNNRYCAFLDILGFKNILNQCKPQDLGELLCTVFQSSLQAAATGETVDVGSIRKNPESVTMPEGINCYQFSDSIIIFSEDDQLASLVKIIRMLNIFISKTMLFGLPIRGGLVKAELFVKTPIILGPGLTESYFLEQRLSSAGVIVDPSCFSSDVAAQELLQKLRDEKLIVRQSVEVTEPKCNPKISTLEEHDLIGWPQFMGLYIQNEKDFIDRFTKLTGHPSKERHERILNNSLDFFLRNMGGKQAPAFNYGIVSTLQIEEGRVSVVLPG